MGTDGKADATLTADAALTGEVPKESREEVKQVRTDRLPQQPPESRETAPQLRLFGGEQLELLCHMLPETLPPAHQFNLC